MNCLQLGLIALIRSAVTGQAHQLPPEFDLEAAYPHILKHQMETLAYEGAVRCGVSKQTPAMQKLFQGYYKHYLQSERQTRAIADLCEAFEANRVAYLPLKGCNLRGLYPRPELRSMNDADILVQVAQYGTIRQLLQQLGYSEKKETDHEMVWSSSALYLELHKRLFSPANPEYYSYFGNGWKLAVPVCGSRYGMSKEDEFLYVFTHFAKHYRNGGIGFRHVTDLWIYHRANPELDQAYLTEGLRKLRLLEFWQNMEQLLAVWFEGAETDEKTAFLTDVIFRSGAWGDVQSQTVASVVREEAKSGHPFGGRLRRLWKLVFLPYRYMKQKYRVLRYLPFLLPVFWVVRIVTVLFCRQETLRQQSYALTQATDEQTAAYRQALQYVGLEFHFEED